MADETNVSIDELQQAIADLEAQQRKLGIDLSQQIAELHQRMADLRGISPQRSGAIATHGGVGAGEHGVAIGGNLYGNIYHIYQSAQGPAALSQDAFERILNDYLGWVHKAYSQARLYGLESLPTAQGRPVRALSQVFIPLSLHRFQPPRREAIEQLAKDLHGDEARAYLRLAETQQQESAEIRFTELLTLNDRLAIIGGAGSGKSTIVAYLAALLSAAALDGEPSPMPLASQRQTLVPLVIPLRYFREYAHANEQAPHERLTHPWAGTLAGFIPWYLMRRSPALETSQDFFDRLLRGGGCLLMLDGLDEVVSRDVRGQVRQQVEQIVTDMYPGNVVLVTAREAGYRENAVFGDDFLRLDVRRLDDAQIQALVEKWCHQLYPGEEKQRTTELIDAIQDVNALRSDRDLPPLISTPLMTTMVVSVKWGEAELPRERAKLYEACLKVILQAQYIPEDTARKALVEWGGAWEEQRDWLSVLALAMHQGGQAGAAVSEDQLRTLLAAELSPERLQQFIEAVRHRGGVLEERAELFQFVHLTFQEFLAARGLAKKRHDAWPVLQPQLTNAWWREVFLLTYGFAQVDYPPFAQQHLAWLSNQDSDAESRLAGLELAGAAVLELERPNPEARRQQAEQLTKTLTRADAPIAGILRARAGDTLARLGDPRFRADAWFLPAGELLGFVEIPAGPFIMGSRKEGDPDARDEEMPQHTLTLPGYYMARYPVTVAQWQVFVEDSGYTPEDADSLQGVPNHPVVWVSWYEALQYCEWLTERLRVWEQTPEPLKRLLRAKGWQVMLPSEAEWEKAARGQDGRIYPWGNTFDSNRANVDETGIGTTSAVGCFPDGASPYGILDLSGNVWEWTRSLWGRDFDKPEYRYPYQPNDGREDLNASNDVRRVLRGGGFFSQSEGRPLCLPRQACPCRRRRQQGVSCCRAPSSGL